MVTFKLALFLTAALALAQTPLAPEANQNSTMLSLNVVVTDKSGKPVPGLAQQDFAILDNKHPQKIGSFHVAETRGPTPDPPVEIILLIDHVNGSTTDTAVQRIAVEKFLDRDNGELARPTSLAFLVDSGITIGSRVTQDGKSLAADLAQQVVGVRTVTTSQGIYGDADRLNRSLKGLWDLVSYEMDRPGRKFVIWISPGWPVLARVMLDRKQQQDIRQRAVTISGGLRMANITLYHVNPLGAAAGFDFQTTGYRDFLKGVKTAADAQFGNLGLPVIATQSGGRVLNASNDISSEIAECVQDASAFYTIGFDPGTGGKPDEYHALEVKVEKPGLSARTLTGYYAHSVSK